MIDKDKMWYRVLAESTILEIEVVQVRLHAGAGNTEEYDSEGKERGGPSRRRDWMSNMMSQRQDDS